MTKIKICGITNIDDAIYAASMKVDFIGFIFYPPSARYIAPERAAEIVRSVHKHGSKNTPQFVGVFVDESLHIVQKIREQVGLGLVQLHGNETSRMVKELQPGAFKALRPTTMREMQNVSRDYIAAQPLNNQLPQILIDAYHPTEKGGTGQLSDLTLAKWLSQRYRLLLAGGLDAGNVSAIIQMVRPWGVDVSSGVEVMANGQLVKGCKDHRKIKAFIKAVQSA